MSLFSSDYDYALPEELIAQYPPERRDQSRLMVLDRANQSVSHHCFSEFPDLLRPSELVVLNDTRVMPARIRFTDRNAEILLLEQIEAGTWRALVRPGKWFRVGRRFVLGQTSGEVLGITEQGDRMIRFDQSLDLKAIGELPLPPYLNRPSEPIDQERYQTVFARRPGAVAAPTAGLHFTKDILERVPHVYVTLEIGPGTFQPVKAARITDHSMHWEAFEVTPAAAKKLREAERVLAVGTTTVRVLETLAERGSIIPGRSKTNIFIHPPFNFRRVNSLLTNFHLPRSTLLMLVSAFAGRELIRKAYAEAVAARYRFFSYGDCMLIR
jgi:S-adenosylmethionine:tRNA ribosyltransferase-isomerase